VNRVTPAFKEWHVIVEALGAGEQILILRKGGIAEGRGGFALKAEKFWLFPTRFHEQAARTKPPAKKYFAGLPADTDRIEIVHFAEVTRHVFLADWAAVAKLDAFHFWSEETARERFNFAQPPGLHAFVVRVHRLLKPVQLEITPEMAGCKSWIDLPLDFAAQPSEPVLDDERFNQKLNLIRFAQGASFGSDV
jgi:hypothetical protein